MSLVLKTCKKCGEMKVLAAFGKKAKARDGLEYQCNACSAFRAMAYRSTNPDKNRAAAAKWRLANPDKAKDAVAKYRSIEANKEKSRVRQADYRRSNIEKTRARDAARRTENPELNRIKLQNRRAKKRANGGNLSKGLSAKLFLLQKGKCACCGKPLSDDYHLDHIMPIALDGTNTDDNIQLLCPPCNLSKGAKHPVDFMQKIGLLL